MDQEAATTPPPPPLLKPFYASLVVVILGSACALLRWNQAAQFARRVDVFLRCRRRTAIDLCAALVFRARGSSSSSSSSSSTTARLIPTGFHLRFDDEPVNSMITQAAGFRRRCVTCPRPSPTDRPSVRPARKIIFSVASPIPSAHCQAAAVRLPSRTVKKKSGAIHRFSSSSSSRPFFSFPFYIQAALQRPPPPTPNCWTPALCFSFLTALE